MPEYEDKIKRPDLSGFKSKKRPRIKRYSNEPTKSDLDEIPRITSIEQIPPAFRMRFKTNTPGEYDTELEPPSEPFDILDSPAYRIPLKRNDGGIDKRFVSASEPVDILDSPAYRIRLKTNDPDNPETTVYDAFIKPQNQIAANSTKSTQTPEDKNLLEKGVDVFERGVQISQDIDTAIQYSHEFADEAKSILTDEMLELGKGILIGMASGVVLTTIASGVGAAIAAAFSGGAAAPAGAKLGADIALLILNVLGIGFLLVETGKQLGTVTAIFGEFAEDVLDAKGDQEKLKQAGKKYVYGIVELYLLIIQALLIYASAKGLGKTLERVGRTPFGKQIGIQKLERFLNDKLRLKDGLEKVRPHLTKIEPLARTQLPGITKGKDKGLFTIFKEKEISGRAKPKKIPIKIPSKNVVAIELKPNKNAKQARIEKIEIFDKSDKFLGKIKAPKNETDPKAAWRIPASSDYKIRITPKEGKPVTFTPGEKPPPGYRYKLNIESAKLRDEGFAGGHTIKAWNEMMQTYGDKVTVTSRSKIKFTLPGKDKPMEVDFNRYEIQGLKGKNKQPNPTVHQPKSVFGGSEETSQKNLIDFEQHIINYASAASKKPPNKFKLVNLQIPVKGKNGKWTKLKVQIAVSKDPNNQSKFGTIKSWWITEDNKLNPDLQP